MGTRVLMFAFVDLLVAVSLAEVSVDVVLVRMEFRDVVVVVVVVEVFVVVVVEDGPLSFGDMVIPAPYLGRLFGRTRALHE